MVNETMNKQQAKAILQFHKNTTLMFLLTIEGLVVFAVENAINAAIKIVQKAGRHRHQVVVVQSGDVPPMVLMGRIFGRRNTLPGSSRVRRRGI